MRKGFFAALFLLPVIFLLPSLNLFPYQPASEYSDLVVSHMPNAIFLQRALLQWGEIPLWSPTILSGYPFSANPLSGLYYLPGWLAWMLPLPFGFNLLVMVHLIFAGVGMYLFLKSLGLSEWAALYGGLAFEVLPKLYSHLGAGHVTLLYAVAWTPWLLLAEQRSTGSGRMRWVLPGAILGILTLADVRWLAYAGVVWVAFSLLSRLSNGSRLSWPVWMASRLTNGIIAALVAAPLLLPLAQYTALSTRQWLSPSESFVLSLPPGQLFGLIYPAIGGSAEWVLYPGAVTFALVLFAFSRRSVRRRCAVWLILILATLVYSLGSFLPPLELLAALPGFDLLRVPPRMLFLTGFCCAAAAAYGLDALLEVVSSREVRGGRAGLVLFAVTAFAVLFAAAAWTVVDEPLTRIQFAWGALFLLIGTAVVMLAQNGRISARVLVLLIFIPGLIDLIAVNRLSLDFRPAAAVFAQGQPAAEFLLQKEGDRPFRVYSPSYSLPQHVAAAYGLELSDGVDPLQLASYVTYMETASGVPTAGYSVTLPAFAEANPQVDNQGYTPDAARLGLLNVRYVVSEFPIQADGLVQAAEFGQTRVYENTKALPRAWLQPPDEPIGEGSIVPVEVRISPNKITFDGVSGPGLLVLSEINYPGWQALLDGRPVEIQNAVGLLRSISISAGTHSLEMRFRPMPVYLGLALSAVAWIFLLLFSQGSIRSEAKDEGHQ